MAAVTPPMAFCFAWSQARIVHSLTGHTWVMVVRKLVSTSRRPWWDIRRLDFSQLRPYARLVETNMIGMWINDLMRESKNVEIS